MFIYLTNLSGFYLKELTQALIDKHGKRFVLYSTETLSAASLLEAVKDAPNPPVTFIYATNLPVSQTNLRALERHLITLNTLSIDVGALPVDYQTLLTKDTYGTS